MNYEYDDYDSYEPYEGRVLWGRIAVYLGSLVFAFVLGGCIFGGGVSQSEYEQSQAQVQELSEQVATLEQEIQVLEQQDRPTVDNGDEDAEDNGDPDDPDADTAEDVQIHEVVEGDSLSTIAQEYYGDSSLWEPIADENDMESGNLTIGEELVIPPLAEVDADADPDENGDADTDDTDPDETDPDETDPDEEDTEAEEEPAATG